MERLRQPRNRRTDEPAIAMWVTGAILSVVLAVILVPFVVGLFGVPIGVPIAVGICALPMWRAGKRVAARERQWSALRGQCIRCGYDLRASAERCPECGEPITERGT